MVLPSWFGSSDEFNAIISAIKALENSDVFYKKCKISASQESKKFLRSAFFVFVRPKWGKTSWCWLSLQFGAIPIKRMLAKYSYSLKFSAFPLLTSLHNLYITHIEPLPSLRMLIM